MRTLQQIAEALLGQLKRNQMTKEALRREVGVSRQTVTNVFSGRQDYRLTTLLAVCDRLGLDLVLIPRELGESATDKPSTPVVKSVVQAALDRLGPPGKGSAP